MHEPRYDWLADRWVIFAPNREDRPNEYCATKKPSEPVMRSKACPFCSGAEHETPEPTLVLPESDRESTRTLYRSNRSSVRSGGSEQSRAPWLVRVVPNKFPAITGKDDSSRDSRVHSSGITSGVSISGQGNSQHASRDFHRSHSGLHDISSALEGDLFQSVATLPAANASHLFQREIVSGTHEVIIESPTHTDSLTELPVDQIRYVLQAYQLRLAHWRSQTGLQYAVVFKNYGSDAGASLSHSHSQLMCMDFVPSNVEWTHRRLSNYRRQYQQCYYCQILGEELKARERIVAETEHFVVVCPFASRFPFSFSILPRQHRAHFDEVNSNELSDLAFALRASLTALERSQPLAAYNYIIQTAPFQSPDFGAHHWRVRVIPRLCKVAGFEWGSDCFINTVTPELAAETLRSNWPS